MEKIFDGLERFLSRTLTWGIDHAPIPANLRARIQGKHDILSEMVKFGMAGGVATLVYLTVLTTLKLVLDPGDDDSFGTATLNVIANIPAILTAYLVSAHFVFKEAVGRRRRVELTMFFVVSFLALGFQTAALWVVENILRDGRVLNLLQTYVVVFLATLASWGVRFFIARRMIFQAHLSSEDGFEDGLVIEGQSGTGTTEMVGTARE